MFDCGYANERSQIIRDCPFKTASPCMDFVPGSKICNRHMAPFNLKQVYTSYHDCNNEQWSKVALYLTGNLNIPLFKNSPGVVDMLEIKSFAESVKYLYPEINLINFANSMACMMELSAVQPMKTNSWLETTEVYALDSDGSFIQMKLPYLHRILFQFALPAYTKRPGNTELDVLVANVILQYNPHSVDSTSYRFKVPTHAKAITLISTDKENSVATPVVLLALHAGGNNTESRCFTTKVSSGPLFLR